MFSKGLSRSAVSVLGFVFALSICIGFSGNIAIAENPPGFPDLPDECGNNSEFTTDFLLEDCKAFKNKGENPYFILKPGYQLVLEGVEEDEEGEETLVREEVTVLCDTKVINFNGRRIKTRVVEERALERESEDEDWKTIEISQNYIAICERTNDVVYFGEFSRDCLDEDGFGENDDCDEVSIVGSWEAGVDGALPGILMPGTFLLWSKYFQEIAPPDAVDRAEHIAIGVSVDIPELEILRDNCVTVVDTNPAAGECGDEDSKTYCPGIGKVRDAVLELVSYSFVGCDDDDHDKRWKGNWRYGHWRF